MEPNSYAYNLCFVSSQVRNTFLKSHEILFFSTYASRIILWNSSYRRRRSRCHVLRARTHKSTNILNMLVHHNIYSVKSYYYRRVYPPINRNIRVRSYTSHSGYRQLPVRTCEMHHVASAAGMAFPAAVSPNAIQIPGRVRRPALPGRPRLGQ